MALGTSTSEHAPGPNLTTAPADHPDHAKRWWILAVLGVAQLMEAITLALPNYKTGTLQTQFPLPFHGDWKPFLGIEVTASQLLVLIVVPVITVGLWWLLGHTAFGDSVRAASSRRA